MLNDTIVANITPFYDDDMYYIEPAKLTYSYEYTSDSYVVKLKESDAINVASILKRKNNKEELLWQL